MGMVNANFLPASPGLSLGSAVQQWLVNGANPLVTSINPIAFGTTPQFISSSAFSVFTITLTGNVTSSTYSGPAGLVVFQITQDNIGGRSFIWPVIFQQATDIGTTANQTTMQLFYFDGTNAWPLGPGVLTP